MLEGPLPVITPLLRHRHRLHVDGCVGTRTYLGRRSKVELPFSVFSVSFIAFLWFLFLANPWDLWSGVRRRARERSTNQVHRTTTSGTSKHSILWRPEPRRIHNLRDRGQWTNRHYYSSHGIPGLHQKHPFWTSSTWGPTDILIPALRSHWCSYTQRVPESVPRNYAIFCSLSWLIIERVWSCFVGVSSRASSMSSLRPVVHLGKVRINESIR